MSFLQFTSHDVPHKDWWLRSLSKKILLSASVFFCVVSLFDQNLPRLGRYQNTHVSLS